MQFISDAIVAVITIWQEARGEDYLGKVAVARVIRNRMHQRYFSDGTAIGTALTPFAFSGWNSNDKNRIPSLRIDDHDPIVIDCIKAWQESETNDAGVQDAVLYCNDKILGHPPLWAVPAKKVITIGQHTFYRK